MQYQGCTVENISLTGENSIQGCQGIGGIVGTGFDWIRDCTASVDITVLDDDGACAGIIAGGTTYSSLTGCYADGGSITAEGNACWGLGGICGAPYGAAEITDCTAEDITITVSGQGNRLIGGLVGGVKEESSESGTMSAFSVKDCTVSGTIEGGAASIGSAVGDAPEGQEMPWMQKPGRLFGKSSRILTASRRLRLPVKSWRLRPI